MASRRTSSSPRAWRAAATSAMAAAVAGSMAGRVDVVVCHAPSSLRPGMRASSQPFVSSAAAIEALGMKRSLKASQS